MEQALLELLGRLEAIEAQHAGAGLGDTNVRDHMGDAVFRGFIKPEPGFVLTDEYGLGTAEANRLVKEALADFIAGARAAAAREGLDSFHKRLAAFQNHDVRTVHTSDFNDYFGWSDPKWFDEAGNDKP